MTTLKPLPNSKPKKPLYYNEVVQVYDVVKVKANAKHNPTDALEELRNQLKNKKAVKANLLAREEVIELKKKGIGKSPKLKRIPYSAVKSFYQFSTSPAFVVVGVQGNDIPKQYVILAAPSVEKANKLIEILQVGQLAPKNNLKNQVPPLVLSDLVREEEAPWSPISPPARTSTHSPSPKRQTTSMRTPSQSTHRQKSPSARRKSRKSSSSSSSSKGRSLSFPSYPEKRRDASANSPSPPPQKYTKKTISVSTSTLIQIPISRNSPSPNPVPMQNKSMNMGYTEDRSFFVYYNPPSRMKKEKKSKSWESDTPAFYYTPNDSSSSENEYERKVSKARSEAQPGVYLMANKKPKVKRVKNLKKRSASVDTGLSSKIYYFSSNDSSNSTSSSDSEEETYVVQRIRKPVKSSPRRSRHSPNRSWRSPPRGRYPSSSTSSSSSSSSSIRRRSSSSSSPSRPRSYKNRKGKITNIPIVYCFPTNRRAK